MIEKLECGHLVDIQPGRAVYSWPDEGFCHVDRVGQEGDSILPGAWHDVISSGDGRWPIGQTASLDASSLLCESCGRRRLTQP